MSIKHKLEVLQVLLESKANIYETRENYCSPASSLQMAAELGNIVALGFLLENSEPELWINQRMYQGANWTAAPLMLALRRSQVAAARLLLANGADPIQPDSDGVTPLMQAGRIGDVDLVQEILQQGACVNLRCRRGFSALVYTTDRVVIQHLLEIKARVDKAYSGDHPLNMAAEKGLGSVVKRLLELKAATADTKKYKGLSQWHCCRV